MAEQGHPGHAGEDAEVSLPPDDAAGDALWNDWDTAPRIAPMPVLHLEGFDGPMDQLLDLVERKRIDFARMSPLAIVDQLNAALAHLARHLALERRADLVILASRLLLLRSRLLFPEHSQHIEAAGQLAGGLSSHADRSVMRTAADWMQRRPQLGRDVFARPSPGSSPGSSPRLAGYMALMEACLAVLEGRAGLGEEVSSFRPPVRDFWTVALARRHIRAELSKRPEGGDLLSFVPAIPDTPERVLKIRAAVAGTLMASLEMAREAEVSLDQPLFADPITVRPGQLAVHSSAPTHSVAAPAGGEDDRHRPGPTAVIL